MARVMAGVICAVVVLAATLILWTWNDMREAASPETEILPEPCRTVSFEGAEHIVCAVDPKKYAVALHRTGVDDMPYERLDRLAAAVQFSFAMNAGMYHEDFSPVGLYVENGQEIVPLNTEDAAGNFFMKPNGVFFVGKDGTPGVLETSVYAAANPQVESATQSGPMLVIDGEIHPRFEPDGQSRHVRNGVGIDGEGRAIFAISRAQVSLGKFARLFRDKLGCANALFFDGAISAMHDGSRYLVGGEFPAGPIVVVAGRGNPSR